MIEIATSAAFLLSSLYGAGQVNAAIQSLPAASAVNVAEQTIADDGIDMATSTLENPKAVEAYVRKAYAGEPILVDIASCESSFRQFDVDGRAVRGEVNREDVGVMQINEHYHADEARKLGDDIYTLQGNVAFAKYLYDKYGTDPWSSSEACWSVAASGAIAGK